MDVTGLLDAALLVVVVLAALLSVAGVARMHGAHDRLHYLAPVSTVGMAAAALAVVRTARSK